MSDAARPGSSCAWMEHEIREQPAALERAVAGLEHDLSLCLANDTAWERALDGLTAVRLVGCGTAAHAGLFGSYLIERWARLPAYPELAGQFRLREPPLGPRDLIVALSQSGATTETRDALRWARRAGAPTLAITGTPDSPLARDAEWALDSRAGCERAIPSTKGFTTQLVALHLWALSIGASRGPHAEAREREVDRRALDELAPLAARALDLWPAVERVAQELAQAPNLVVLGRGPGYPIALEGALKVTEASYLPAQGYAADEFRHGSIARIDAATPVVLLANGPQALAPMLDLGQELARCGAPIVALSSDRGGALPGFVGHTLRLPYAPEPLASLLATLPLQMLACEIGRARGVNVDAPRNLTKCVLRGAAQQADRESSPEGK